MQSIKTVLLYRSDRQDFAAKLSADIKANIEEHDTEVTLLTVEDFLSAEDISDISSIFGLFDDPDTVMDDAFANALSRASNIITPFVPVFFSEKYLQKGANIPFVITYIMGLARQAVKAWEKNYDELVVAISGAMISIAAEKKAQPAAHSSTDEKPKISTDYDVEMQNGNYWLERYRNHPEASHSDVKTDLDKAHECFDRAAKLNPDMAAPYVGILECYAIERINNKSRKEFSSKLSLICSCRDKIKISSDSSYARIYASAVDNVINNYLETLDRNPEKLSTISLEDYHKQIESILGYSDFEKLFSYDQKAKLNAIKKNYRHLIKSRKKEAFSNKSAEILKHSVSIILLAIGFILTIFNTISLYSDYQGIYKSVPILSLYFVIFIDENVIVNFLFDVVAYGIINGVISCITFILIRILTGRLPDYLKNYKTDIADCLVYAPTSMLIINFIELIGVWIIGFIYFALAK